MKKIFSSVLTLFSLPIRYFRKSKIDNFIGGLIFGSIFSLFVNLITVQFQETIQKQRILEAVEMEIVSNMLMSNDYVQFAAKEIENESEPNPYYRFPMLSTRVWDTSEALKYIATLDPDLQAKLISHYTYAIEGTNKITEIENQIYIDKFKDCYYDVNEDRKKECRNQYISTINRNIDGVGRYYNYGSELLDVFHPTQNRLNSKMLRFVMGSNAVKILQGE